MTRREEIVKDLGLSEVVQESIKRYPRFAERRCGFIAGAEWMQKKMIEKACDWIETYLFDIGFPDDWCRDSATMKSGKQRFLEAMEE